MAIHRTKHENNHHTNTHATHDDSMQCHSAAIASDVFTRDEIATFIHLARSYQTPLYVYDMTKITQNFLAFKQAFSGRKSLICYALKANANLSVLKLLGELGSGADCVSIGEVRRALLAGIPKYKIIFSGVGKRDDEIAEALQSDILFINVESAEELYRIESIARSLAQSRTQDLHSQECAQTTATTDQTTAHNPSLKARISIRVNPNIDPKTHPYISTGLHENKFGVDIESAKQMYIYAHKSAFLEPIGIHFHIGSQLTEIEPLIQSSQKIAALARSLLALGMGIKFFDIGGGLGIRYTDENPIDLYTYAQGILSTLSGCDWTIICEPGRRIVGDCGYLLTKVINQKLTSNKRFVIVDAGMNDLMRPALYGAFHQPILFSELDSTSELDFTQEQSVAEFTTESKKQATLADIVGPVCESSDVFCKNIALPPLQSGDLLAFSNAGAYGYSMASPYNARSRPMEIGLYEDGARVIKHRESFESSVQDELALLDSSK